ncbi:tRNA-guanine transglycosylase [Tsukamurella ocularis]|uniref:tRNA-guanine transglycosylase n=1 Tax=Tsukamurella ocularis TaxID=1970234 RepID=UPI0021670786|nr:tRNA-guanine transglycosylase [Tsukamurella ocularis]MCS3781757.1 putative membrane protein YdfJ with MMPL/SSD domain/queuine/archaeosine tRNA-ribosyltransferase [Tsukamurella ocularis]MCS3788251.1 putative membrane protein YdfJ with MMPL/SSD domain/queuine/archaeosine tRNA-ribosyltransferase [Tsukamurella ocularis]MCS3851971.1 putative membrane protein YdfJ with MMPL/SSD domain/queuine/archaeosine tRNA-ribosyltransferase [Tsukamurella ocularis]
MASLLYKVGRFCYRKWWLVLVLWIVAFLAIGAAGSSLSKPFKDDFNLPGSRAVEAQNVLQEKFPETAKTQAPTATVVLQSTNGQRLDQGGNAAAVNAVVDKLRQVPQLTTAEKASVPNPTMGAAAAENLSSDGRTAQIHFSFGDVKEVSEESIEAVAAAKKAGTDAGLKVESAGSANETEAEPPAEMIGIAVAVIVMIITFAALLAALMPLGAALIGIGLSTSIIAIGTSFLTLSTSTTGLSMMIGLAVGIDYSLFVISRYRQELMTTSDRSHAAGLAVGTAGSAVVFAGATVIIALCGLSITGMSFLSQMGLGAAVTVALAVLVALTVLPALLGLFKSKVFTPRLPLLWTPEQTERRPMGQRIGELLTRKPLPFLVGAVAILALAAIPIGKLELGLDFAAPSDKAAVQMQSEAFGAGKSSPLVAVVDTQGKGDLKAATQRFAEQARALPGIAHDGVIGPVPNVTGDAAQFIIVPESGPSTKQTAALLDELRDRAETVGGATSTYIGIGGAAAINADFSETLTSKLPLYLIVVVGLAILLLMIVFRSVIIPVIASLGFLLSIAATFGVTVGFFQDGWLGWIAPEERGPILVFMPIFLIGIVFGLAMDYQVFLVSRMREEHYHGAPALEAIRIGYRSGARVVTAAAIIMISVFAGFTLSSMTFLKLMGFSMAAAIVFDAFLVRMIIMPTAMAVLGERAWWIPRWLDKALPRIDVEGDGLRAMNVGADADTAPVQQNPAIAAAERTADPTRVPAPRPPAAGAAPALIPTRARTGAGAGAPQARRSTAELAELRASNRALAAELSELRSDYRSLSAHARLQADSVTDPVRFEVTGGSDAARSGTLHTAQRTIATPAFVASAPLGAIPGVDPASAERLGAGAITVDGARLALHPGAETIEEAGGLAAVTGSDLSLFVDVSAPSSDPAAAVTAAYQLGGDVVFAPAAASGVRRALAEHNWLTALRRGEMSLWASVPVRLVHDRAALRDLLARHEEDVRSGGLGFGGVRIIGAASDPQAGEALVQLTTALNAALPRYLTAVRGPEDLLHAIGAGVDLVESAAPQDLANRGIALTAEGAIAVSTPAFRDDVRPLDATPVQDRVAPSPIRAYVHHLYRTDAPSAVQAVTRHNLRFLTALTEGARRAIDEGRFPAYRDAFLQRFSGGDATRDGRVDDHDGDVAATAH